LLKAYNFYSYNKSCNKEREKVRRDNYNCVCVCVCVLNQKKIKEVTFKKTTVYLIFESIFPSLRPNTAIRHDFRLVRNYRVID